MTTPDNELVSRAIGRARFLRDRDEIKTPELIEDLLARLETLVAEKRSLQRMVELFPEAHDTLTRQEMRDAKGNWRSLIDQQNNALAALRAALKDTTDDRLGEEA